MDLNDGWVAPGQKYGQNLRKLYAKEPYEIAKKRREHLRKPCPLCGTLMAAEVIAPKMCAECRKKNPLGVRWTHETIIKAMQDFHAATGRAPTVTDRIALMPSQKSHFSKERLAEATHLNKLKIDIPNPATVQRVFGSWQKGILAAGLKPAPNGGAAHRSPKRHNKTPVPTLRSESAG